MALKRKLQVFVSSTYTDLKEERQAAVQAILKAGHIPAGMELFTAGDESQLDTIKRWIDESDIYMLILGGRYGSIEPLSGLSYTEVEYDYAADRMPYFAVVIEEEELQRRLENGNWSSDSPELLAALREKVLSSMSSFFTAPSDVKLAVHETVNEFQQRHNLEGWVKGAAVENTDLLAQLNEVRQETETIRQQKEAVERELESYNVGQDEIAFGDDLLKLSGSYLTKRYDERRTWESVMSWNHIFSVIGPPMLNQNANEEAITRMIALAALKMLHIGDVGSNARVDDRDLGTIKVQLVALELVSVAVFPTVAKTTALFWTLTEKGKTHLLQTRTTSKEKAKAVAEEVARAREKQKGLLDALVKAEITKPTKQ